MSAKPQNEKQLATVLVEKWEQLAKKVAELVEEFPTEKFESQPVAGIRSCGEVVRHVAFWNQYVADTLKGKKGNDSLNELARADYPTKASALAALQQSAEDVSTALRENRGEPNSKTMDLVMSFAEHTAEHYGQLVVYGRLIGIVPPASRG
jgi:uncharacterized damage-inducible protein DinB